MNDIKFFVKGLMGLPPDKKKHNLHLLDREKYLESRNADAKAQLEERITIYSTALEQREWSTSTDLMTATGLTRSAVLGHMAKKCMQELTDRKTMVNAKGKDSYYWRLKSWK